MSEEGPSATPLGLCAGKAWSLQANQSMENHDFLRKASENVGNFSSVKGEGRVKKNEELTKYSLIDMSPK